MATVLYSMNLYVAIIGNKAFKETLFLFLSLQKAFENWKQYSNICLNKCGKTKKRTIVKRVWRCNYKSWRLFVFLTIETCHFFPHVNLKFEFTVLTIYNSIIMQNDKNLHLWRKSNQLFLRLSTAVWGKVCLWLALPCCMSQYMGQ